MEQEIKINGKELMERLAKLQADVNYLKNHIEDSTLTENDVVSLEEAEVDLKKGKTKRI